MLEAYLTETVASTDLFVRFAPNKLAAGRAVLQADPHQQVAFICAALDWLAIQNSRAGAYYRSLDRLSAILGKLLRKPLPFQEADLCRILRRLATIRQVWLGYLPLRSFIGAVARHVDQNGLSPDVRAALEALRSVGAREAIYADGRKAMAMVDEILGRAQDREGPSPLFPEDDYGATAAVVLEQIQEPERSAW